MKGFPLLGVLFLLSCSGIKARVFVVTTLDTEDREVSCVVSVDDQMLLDDAALREKFGRHSVDFVLDHHTMEQHVYNYIDVYHQACEQKAA